MRFARNHIHICKQDTFTPVLRLIQPLREAFLFFGSRQLMVAKMNRRAGAKKTKKDDSGELLSSADAPYKWCVCQRNASL